MTPDLNDLTAEALLRYQAQAKNPAVCALVELVGLCVGLGGLGIMLGGRVGLGVVALFAYWGIALVCIPLALSSGVLLLPVVWLGWAALSVVSAMQTARAYNEALRYRVAGLEPPARRGGGVGGVLLAVVGIVVGLLGVTTLAGVLILLSESVPG